VKLGIKVMEEDIRSATRGHACDCPVARATARAALQVLGVRAVVRVGLVIRIVTKDRRAFASVDALPTEVLRWIQGYDGGEEREPIAFEVEFTPMVFGLGDEIDHMVLSA